MDRAAAASAMHAGRRSLAQVVLKATQLEVRPLQACIMLTARRTRIACHPHSPMVHQLVLICVCNAAGDTRSCMSGSNAASDYRPPSSIRSSEPSTIARNKIAELEVRYICPLRSSAVQSGRVRSIWRACSGVQQCRAVQCGREDTARKTTHDATCDAMRAAPGHARAEMVRRSSHRSQEYERYCKPHC